jgi:hypothetical protein
MTNPPKLKQKKKNQINQRKVNTIIKKKKKKKLTFIKETNFKRFNTHPLGKQQNTI